jgi:hypothetical protein
MTYGEMENFVMNMDDKKIIDICENIYYWRETGTLGEGTVLSKLAKESNFPDVKMIETLVISEAHTRYKNLVLLLMKDMPSNYMK